MDSARKAAINAATGYVMLKAFANDSSKGTVSGMPVSLLFPAAVAGATFASDLTHAYVFPAMHISEKWSTPAVATANGVAGAAFSSGLMWLSDKDKSMTKGQVLQSGILGAVSIIVGDYINEKYVSP